MAANLQSLILLLLIATNKLYLAWSYGVVGSSSLPLSPSTSFRVPSCPMNYMFTCQPQLAVVPCAQSLPAATPFSGSSGNLVGAYSEQQTAAVAQPPPTAASTSGPETENTYQKPVYFSASPHYHLPSSSA